MLIFDLESDGLLPELTRIHCLWIYATTTKRFYGFDKKDVPKGLDMLAKADAICGHLWAHKKGPPKRTLLHSGRPKSYLKTLP